MAKLLKDDADYYQIKSHKILQLIIIKYIIYQFLFTTFSCSTQYVPLFTCIRI